ncbi:hypothetical protein BHE74_00017861 [Ensete ventricosum]|nr:hypothetical protein GW17_00024642 [Ensete ventricosum]RWW74211.1 hypothetical protein BHE74_00017861 [Ensete ventricosum]
MTATASLPTSIVTRTAAIRSNPRDQECGARRFHPWGLRRSKSISRGGRTRMPKSARLCTPTADTVCRSIGVK